jgi:hypothetical protein
MGNAAAPAKKPICVGFNMRSSFYFLQLDTCIVIQCTITSAKPTNNPFINCHHTKHFSNALLKKGVSPFE